MEISEYRAMYNSEERHWWYVSLHELIAHCVNRERRGNGLLKIFDAGCGTGRLCQILSEHGTVSGCDVSDTAISFCRERGLETVRLEDLNSFDPGTDCFDIITSIDVLYHRAVIDDTEIVRRLYGSLKPGGLLIVNLPAYEALRSAHDRAVHTGRRYTRARVTDMLTASGFVIEKASYRVCLLFVFIAAFRLLKNIFPKPSALGQSSEVELSNRMINRILLAVMRVEHLAMRHISMPFGLSVFAVARKPR
ncbi:MAG: class I SAM-dependent methyltransferase [Nitrospirae bacterium]|nr:class I SAM-dependent methyltransferase [Nitrospirota bacterium]